MDQQGQNSPSPLSSHFVTIPSPPPGSAVRRHQSLTHGTTTTRMASAGLRRAGTLQNQGRTHGHQPEPPSPTGAEEEITEGPASREDESYFARQGQQHPTSPINRSPWSTPSNEWRSSGGNGNLVGTNNGSTTIEDVQRGLSSMDINSQYSAAAFPGAQATPPPRFNPNQPQQFTVLRNAGPNDSDASASARKLQLVTNLDERGNQLTGSTSGPVSASAYVPPIGHGPQSMGQQQHGGTGESDDRAFTASGSWDQKDRVLHTRSSNPNINYGSNAQQQQSKAHGIPSVPPIPPQFLQANQQRLGLNAQSGGLGALGAQPGVLASPIDIPTLIATKGYNPQSFDTRPSFVRHLFLFLTLFF